MRSSFFQARRFGDLDDLNRQATEWSLSVAMQRRWPEDKRLSVAEAFEHEKDKLLVASQESFACEDRVETSVKKTPYVYFDLNDYSVPHTMCQRAVVVLADEDKVRIVRAGELVAEHVRSYDREAQIEDPEHIEKLRREKSAASKSERTHVLSKAAPSSAKLLEALAERGEPLGRTTRLLTELLHTYGAQALEAAIVEALGADAPHVQGVRHILERERREHGRPPPRPMELPDDPRIRDIVVRPHDLSQYDRIAKKETDNDDDSDE